MKAWCPSCGKVDDYEYLIGECVHCKRGVKLRKIEEVATEAKKEIKETKKVSKERENKWR